MSFLPPTTLPSRSQCLHQPQVHGQMSLLLHCRRPHPTQPNRSGNQNRSCLWCSWHGPHFDWSPQCIPRTQEQTVGAYIQRISQTLTIRFRSSIFLIGSYSFSLVYFTHIVKFGILICIFLISEMSELFRFTHRQCFPQRRPTQMSTLLGIDTWFNSSTNSSPCSTHFPCHYTFTTRLNTSRPDTCMGKAHATT